MPLCLRGVLRWPARGSSSGGGWSNTLPAAAPRSLGELFLPCPGPEHPAPSSGHITPLPLCPAPDSRLGCVCLPGDLAHKFSETCGPQTSLIWAENSGIWAPSSAALKERLPGSLFQGEGVMPGGYQAGTGCAQLLNFPVHQTWGINSARDKGPLGFPF